MAIHIVAVDGDNLSRNVREHAAYTPINFRKLERFLRSLFSGRKEDTARLYFSTGLDDPRLTGLNRALIKAGWETITTPVTSRYDAMEGRVVKHGMADRDIAREIRARIRDGVTKTLVLASGDRHFAPLIREARGKGIRTFVVALSAHFSSKLQEVADEAVRLDEYLSKLLIFKDFNRRRR